MDKKTTIKNFLLVSGGNIVQLIANISLGLLLPVILSSNNYGYYKIYTLYIGYCGLLHFGFIDGIVFRYAGTDYENLDKSLFRTYTRWLFLCELICSCTIILLGNIFLDGENRIIAIFVGFYIVPYAMTLYFQYVSQATSRFKELALRKTINAIAIICCIVLFFLLKGNSAEEGIPYWHVMVILQCITIGLLLWYAWTYRGIIFGSCKPMRSVRNDVYDLCRKGILLTISYEVAQLMLQLDRQFVSVLFDIEEYAQYAFAYNILSCITTLVTAISTVMFPLLRRMGKENAIKTLPQGNMIVAMLVCFTFTGTSVIEYLVTKLLPVYIHSVVYFKVVFPALAMSCCITINMYNYYKVLDRVVIYLRKSLVALVLSFVLNVIAYSVFRTPIAISIASIVAMVFWYCLIASNIAKCCCVPWVKDFAYILAMMSVYYTVTYVIAGMVIRCVVYLLAYFLITLLLYRKQIFHLIRN